MMMALCVRCFSCIQWWSQLQITCTYVPCAGRSGRIGSHEKNIMSARKLSLLKEEEEEERCGTKCLLGTSSSGSCFCCCCCEALDFSRKLHHPRFLIYPLLLYNTLDVYYIHREAYNLQGIKLTPFRPGARDGPSPVTPSISPRPPADLQFFFVFCFSFVRSHRHHSPI